jgi:putative transposase
MARRVRISVGGIAYHVLNRRVERRELFGDDGDYAAFEKVLQEAHARFQMRLLDYCLMPNHWHLVLWPERGGLLPRYMQWLTTTHMRRWHAHRGTGGTGPLYQGRFKSFPVQEDGHLLSVCRYVQRNALRANLAPRAQDWRWGSLWQRRQAQPPPWLLVTEQWPVTLPDDWLGMENRPQSDGELEALRRSVRRGAPFGDEAWTRRTAAKLRLESSLRPPWRPRNRKPVAEREK